MVATDNHSVDGTTDVLERYAREGHVHLIREPGDDLRQDEWVTRMARLAATDFGADWVINSDADEFWWPRGASLARVLDAIPPRYGTVGAFLRTFAPRPDGDGSFAERLTVRFSALAPINDPASLYKPIRKVIHRGASGDPAHARKPRRRSTAPSTRCAAGSRSRCSTSRCARVAQCEHKARLQGNAWKHIERTPTAYHAQMFEALESGTMADYYAAQVVSDEEVERGVADGRLVVDTRLRDALRRLEAGRRPARRSRRRRSSTRRRTRSRRPSSARPTSSGSSVGSTRSSIGSRPSSRASRTGSTASSSVPAKRVLAALALDGSETDHDLVERVVRVELVAASDRTRRARRGSPTP